MMKKILKRSAYLLLMVILSTLTYSYVKFNFYAPSDAAFDTDEQLLSYYSESYDLAREQFLDKVSEAGFDEHTTFKVPSLVDTSLYVDVCYAPPKGKMNKLVVVTSGLHGVEGYTGSAIQSLFLDKIKTVERADEMGFLFVHALNPYGFKYGRKVTENNVDLNRNCVLTQDDYESKNTGFTLIYDMLTPKGPVKVQSVRNLSFHLVAISKIIQKSMSTLRQAALQGQYEYPEGIYYGSQAHEPQISALMPLLKSYFKGYNTILNVDLHTGYGERGQMHLFIDRPEDKAVEHGIISVFEGHKIDWSEGADFYTINGEYIGLVAAQADSALVIPMMMEFGTMNSQETFGSLKSIHTMILENEGANHGFANAKSEQKVKSDMMELYCPTSEAWRSETIRKADSMFDIMMTNFSNY